MIKIFALAKKNWPTLSAAMTAACAAFVSAFGVPPEIAAGFASGIMTALVAVAHRLEAPK